MKRRPDHPQPPVDENFERRWQDAQNDQFLGLILELERRGWSSADASQYAQLYKMSQPNQLSDLPLVELAPAEKERVEKIEEKYGVGKNFAIISEVLGKARK